MPFRRALVTGASAGIGEAIARRLAADGTALVLVARRVERLAALAEELRSHGAPEVEVLPADLSVRAQCALVGERLGADDAPIDLLVNNAAIGGRGRLHERPLDGELAAVALNVEAVVALSHAAASRMVRAGRGAICTISSVAGNQPGPDMATYGATKAFVTFFSQALDHDLRGTGVTSTVVLPGLTHTEFHDVNDIVDDTPERFWMTADEVAEQALAATAAGRRLLVPGAWNKLATVASSPRPRGVRTKVFGIAQYRLKKVLR